MHKKTETQEFNVPEDDIDCWNRYTKHHWVYDLSRLLDAQNVIWSPFKTDFLQTRIPNIRFNTFKKVLYETGYIYINFPTGADITSEVYISKGEIKMIRYFDKSNLELQEYVGNIELRISAFVSIHFQKFTGIITIQSVGNIIMSIRLRPYSEFTSHTNPDIIRLIKRIYKRTDSTFSGLSDQVIHESLTS